MNRVRKPAISIKESETPHLTPGGSSPPSVTSNNVSSPQLLLMPGFSPNPTPKRENQPPAKHRQPITSPTDTDPRS